jgi:hypothetical protein
LKYIIEIALPSPATSIDEICFTGAMAFLDAHTPISRTRFASAFLSFSFLSHQIAFAFHGESPLQVDHLPEAVFLTITAVFFCMAQPKYPTRAG